MVKQEQCPSCGALVGPYDEKCQYCGTAIISQGATELQNMLAESERIKTGVNELEQRMHEQWGTIIKAPGETKEAYNERFQKGEVAREWRLRLSPLFFFTPIVWFFWDVVGAGACRLFSITIAPANQKYFSPIFDINWLIRIGILAAIFIPLGLIDNKLQKLVRGE